MSGSGASADSPSNVSEDLPLCRRSEDIDRESGARVRVRGAYREMDLRRRPTSPPAYVGRAGLELEDGAIVLLEPSWSDSGIRPPEERRRLAGQQVEAVGTLHAEPVQPPRPVAFVHYPCLTPVESVEPSR